MAKIKIGSILFGDVAVQQYHNIYKAMQKQAAASPVSSAALASERALKGHIPERVGEWLLAGLGLGAAGAVMGLGGQAVGLAAGKIGDTAHAAALSKDFNAMLKADPSLKEEEKKAKAYFGILHRASPYLSSEPLLAAATVRTMMEYENAPGDQKIQSILSAEKTFQETRHPWLRPKTSDIPKGVFSVDPNSPLGN